jgi:putative protein-disulfide isomerase
MNKKKEIVAVLDPMCSWCWGFEPVLQSLRDELSGEVEFSLIMGGLRNSGEQVWDDVFKAYLRSHWKSVEEKTNQAFNLDLFEKKAFDYDTEPACRAVVTFRTLDKRKQFSFLTALQEAFYLKGKDITQTDVIADIARAEGVDRNEFIALFTSDEMKEKSKADVYKARSMGANVFPSVVLIDEEGHLCVIKGYKSYKEIRPLLD